MPKLFRIILLSLIMIFILSNTLPERSWIAIGTRYDITKARIEKGTYSRIEFMKAGIKLFSENPILGVGPGNFYRYSEAYGTKRYVLAHNIYLELIADTGLAGMFVFLWILFLGLGNYIDSIRNFRNKPEKSTGIYIEGLYLSFIGYLIYSFFHTNYLYQIIYVYLALSVVSKKIEHSSEPAVSKNDKG